MTIKKLTKEQALVITGFTGTLSCNFADFQSDVEKRLGHPVWTHQFGNKEFSEIVKEIYLADYLAMLEVNND